MDSPSPNVYQQDLAHVSASKTRRRRIGRRRRRRLSIADCQQKKIAKFAHKRWVGGSLLNLITFKIKWLMIDAVDNGYLEFRAMIYGVNPGCYWIDILTRAHG